MASKAMARLGQHLRHRRLMGRHLGALDAPPATYDPSRRYLVQLNQTVPAVPDDPGGTMLRPSDLVEVSGDFANSIANAISGAKLLPPEA